MNILKTYEQQQQQPNTYHSMSLFKFNDRNYLT